MTTLVLALYAEGRTDERFLPIVIQRTAEQILTLRGRMTVDILEPMVLGRKVIDHEKHPTYAERVLAAARHTAGYHALILHADADHPTAERAMSERIQPGLDLVQQTDERVCDQILPLVPIRMTEAWLLADPDALRAVIGTRMDAQALGLPARSRQVESDPDPKQTLQQVIQTALANRPRRRRRLSLGSLYEPLARQINLEQLNMIPAYQQFVDDLTKTLINLHLAN